MMTRPEDFLGGDISGQYCSNCTNADGSLKSLDEITLHIANQLIMSQGIDREAATKAARSILSVQPEWKRVIENRSERDNKRIMIITIAVVVTIASLTTFLLTRQKRDRYYIDPFYAYYLDDNSDQLGFYKLTNDTTSINNDGQEITKIPLEYDQIDISFDQNGNLEFTVDKKTNVKYSITDFNFGYTLPAGFLATPLSFEMNSKDKYLGSIMSGEKPDVTFKTYWLADKPSLRNHVIQEVSSDPNGVKTIGVPFDDNVYFSGDYLVWLEKNTANPVMVSVIGYNSKTGKVFPIDTTLTGKGFIKVGKTCVYWIDAGNPNRNENTVKGFDLLQMKPIETGIPLQSRTYKYNTVAKKNGSYKMEFHISSLWTVAGDEVIYQDISNTGLLKIYIKSSNQNVLFSKSNYIPFYPWFERWSWTERGDPEKSEDYVYVYEFGSKHSFFCDTNQNAKDPFCVWAVKQSDETYSLSYLKKSQFGNTPGSMPEIKPVGMIGITNSWFVWLEKDLTTEGNTLIKGFNLDNQKTLNLGSYKLNDVTNSMESSDIACFNGMLAWSAWTEDAGYDIFYTRLP